MKKVTVVNIGDTDENADWIKTAENRRREIETHAKVLEEHNDQQVVRARID